MTLSEALEAQATPLFWQKTWAEVGVMEPLLNFPERGGMERGENKTIWEGNMHKQ